MQNPFETEERAAFRKNLQVFVATEIKPYADKWDEAGKIPWELHQKVGALGVWGFGIEEKYGGLGFDDCFMRAAYNEEFAKCGANGIPAAMNGRMISIELIQRLASQDIKDRVLEDIVMGRKGSSLGVTEPSGGSDVANTRTKAHRDGNHFVLNGQKNLYYWRHDV
jgi:acyl-CoA dehydrogenase